MQGSPPNVQDDHIALSVAIQVLPEKLVLDYEVTNVGAEAVGLVTSTPRALPGGEYDLKAIFVYFEDSLLGGGDVHVSRQGGQVPSGVDLAVRHSPGITQLAAGAVFHERLELTLPLREWDYYIYPRLVGKHGKVELREEERHAGSIRFSVGYAPLDTPTDFNVGYVAANEAILSTESVDIDVPVVVRRP